MKSTNRRRIIFFSLIALVIGIILTAILLPFRPNAADLDFTIADTNGNYQFEVNEKLDFLLNDTVAYKDRKMVWEFGNGDSIVKARNVNYTYRQPGKYLVTLTLDRQFKFPKYIDVIQVAQNKAIDSVPVIYGVDQGYVNEQLVFSCISPGVTSWYWEFGETGTIDAYERQVIYTYKNPGSYTVKLKTNQSRYPVYHKIEVLPMFQKLTSEPIDSISIVQNDIREKLQAIANAGVRNKPVFYKNLRHIERNYKCDEDIVVVVNGSLYNDLISYCQGLHFLEGRGSKSIEISQVKVDTIHCIKKIEVLQSVIKE